MANVSTEDIKKLRDKTGAGFMDCKKALEESNLDIQKALDWLRKKGISSAEKKGSRSSSDGLIAIENNNNEAIKFLDECKVNLSFVSLKIKEIKKKDLISNFVSKNDEIKQLQENYAESYSKNQNIKKESVKRSERIKIIDQEIESWKNLLNNSEKMVGELNDRKNKQLTYETTFIGVKSAKILEFKKIENIYKVTVNFVSEIITCVKDKNDQVIEGNPDIIISHV